MSEHIVHVGVTFQIAGRHALHGAECSTCGWRSREYLDWNKANDAADKHVAKHASEEKA